ncbi:MAG TPA: ABC transporter ATP-binding protein [Clostridia bacterium]|jgi:ATP-binding cassette subfamily B multidrug efflux pump|nr:ABC transporter ATP-binding protein [Clostridiaceae bacterium]HPZ51590.1 ABC transporter ATP-binding protein [Clostridia bacterium]
MKKKKHTVIRLLQYMKDFKWHLVLALVLTIIGNAFNLIGPMMSGKAISYIEPGTGSVNFQKVFQIAVLMLVVYLLSSILTYLLSLLMVYISRKVVYNMRKDVFEKITTLPVGFFDVNPTGDIISRMSYDIDTINTSLSSDLVQISASFITVIGSLVMMLVISPYLVLVFAFTVPTSIFLTRFITKRTSPLFKARSARLGEMNGFVEEMVTGQKTLRAYNSEDSTIDKFVDYNEKTATAYYKSEYYGSMTGPSINFVNNLSLSLISVFGAIMYLYRTISLGDIASFVLYSRKFSGPINEMANIATELQSALAAAERVFRLLDEEPEKEDSKDAVVLDGVEGDVKLEDVNFGYTKDKLVIKNLNLIAPKGSLVAIVGKTGAGKTTLINLLMRFYDVDDGIILVDGVPVEDITRASLRKSYAMVLQDTWLFSGTVFENIAYGKENASREEVEEAAKAAMIHSFIEKLPKGYDTVLSDDAANISKGQKQLLTIARAMLIDAKILILDEATSNVDTNTEIKIQKAMRNLMKDKTCFVIAHRLSTIRNSDVILVVDEGNIVEMGTHEDLLKKKGMYYEMYYSQFE